MVPVFGLFPTLTSVGLGIVQMFMCLSGLIFLTQGTPLLPQWQLRHI